MFEFLFKYRRIAFEEGDVVFAAPEWVEPTVLVAILVGAMATATYAFVRGRARPGERALLAGTRLLLFGVIAVCLLQPTLVISRVAPQQNFLGLLFDDSRSMALADGDTRRGQVVQERFAEEGELVAGLSERFSVRRFAFAEDAKRISSAAELAFDGTRTDIAGAMSSAAAELSGVPLAGLVLVSDGAANVSSPLAEALVPLQAAGVPVYTVGIGAEVISPDIELGRVEAPRAALLGSSLLVDVVVTQRGMGGDASVPLRVEDDLRILAEEVVELGADGEPVVARVELRLDQPGPQVFRFGIPGQPGESVLENNQRSVHVNVSDERRKILYFEGEPRFEVKFMRRAVADDDNIQLVVLQRTAESKFLRLDVDDGSELEFGFPSEREELYRYAGLVLGSVEASFFTYDQLAMIADFVSARGGGLLFLGGAAAFAEGGWDGTPVEEVMPVLMSPPETSATRGERFFAETKVRPTRAGLSHPAVRLDAEPEEVATRWEMLPPTTLANPISEVRPGATTLLVGATTVVDAAGLDEIENPRSGDEQVVLAFQRYGRGKAIALTIQDSWLWQMHADVPVEDQSHEIFWQRMTRWLVEGVPDPVELVGDKEAAELGETVRFAASVRDSAYLGVNGASVTALATSPDGEVRELTAEWTVDRDGEYAFEYDPAVLGEHSVEVRAELDGEFLGSARSFLVARPSDEEYFGAGQDASALRRIAEATGGRHYTPETLESLPEDIELSGAGVTLVERLDLWDMPALFLLAILLMGTEWGWRRRRGLS